MGKPQRPGADTDGPLWSGLAAYRETYADDWGDLCLFLRARFGAGPPDPEDVAQQAFVTLGERPADQRHESPRAFVFRVAINLTRDAFRRQRLTTRIVGSSDPVLETDAEPDAERTLIAKQELDVLNRVVAGLPPRHRAFLAANRVEGLSFAEIARRHGVSEALVRKTVGEAVAACQRAVAGGAIHFRGLSREGTRT